VFRRLADAACGGVIGARSMVLPGRFDLTAVARVLGQEAEIWDRLVRVERKVSRPAYSALTEESPPLHPKRVSYRIVAGEAPVAVRRRARGRRPSNSPNALG
jgi:hypothetical protein